MNSRKAIMLFSVLATLALGLTGCSSSSTPPPPPVISVAFSPQPPTSLAPGASTPVTAVVSNDSSNGGVQWTLTCTGQCGTISPTTTASGQAATYTAPNVPPSPNTVTVTAVSVTDNTVSASATITIGSSAPVLADGTYVFHLGGEDLAIIGNTVGSPYYAAGAFTIQGGVIVSGEQDFVDLATFAHDSFVAANCRVAVSGDGNIQIVLDTGDTSAKVGVNGVETLTGSLVSGSRMLISEFDAFAASTGSLDLQTSTATPSAGYAFQLSGSDSSSNAFAMGGVLNFSGGNLSASSIYDANDGGTVTLGKIFNSGSVSTPDSFGRVTINLNPSTGVKNLVLAGYIVDASRIQLVESSDAFLGSLGGTAFGQGTNTGLFSTSSVCGKKLRL